MDLYHVNEANYRKATTWSRHADTRANVVLAFNAALVALLVTDNPYTHGFVTSFHLGREAVLSSGVGVAIFAIFLVFFTLSVGCAFRVLMLDARTTQCEHSKTFSFMNIADMTREEYRHTISTMDDNQIIHALQDQTYRAAVLARDKVVWLRRAWIFLIMALCFAMIFVVFTVFFAQSVSQTLH